MRLCPTIVLAHDNATMTTSKAPKRVVLLVDAIHMHMYVSLFVSLSLILCVYFYNSIPHAWRAARVLFSFMSWLENKTTCSYVVDWNNGLIREEVACYIYCWNKLGRSDYKDGKRNVWMGQK